MSARLVTVAGLALATSMLLAGCSSYASALEENNDLEDALVEAVAEQTGEDIQVYLGGTGIRTQLYIDDPENSGERGVAIAEVFAESDLSHRQFNIKFSAEKGNFDWSGYDAADADRFVAANHAWTEVDAIEGLELATSMPSSGVQGNELLFIGDVATEAEVKPARDAIIEIVTEAGFRYREDGIVVTVRE